MEDETDLRDGQKFHKGEENKQHQDITTTQANHD